MNILELVNLLDYDYIGKSDIFVKTIKYASVAQQDDIAIVFSEKELLETKAKIVLTKPRVIKTDKNLIFSHETIENASVKIAQIFIERGYQSDYSKPISYKLIENNVMVGNNSVIGKDTIIEPFCVFGNNVTIGQGCIIESNVYIGSDVIIGNNVIIHSGAKIGVSAFYHYFDESLSSFQGNGTVILEDNTEIGFNTIIQRGTFSDTKIGKYTKIGNLIDIGHDVQIGSNCKIVSQTGIASNVKVGNFVQIFGQVGIANNVIINDKVTIMAKTLVSKEIEEGKVISGMFGREHTEELKLQARLRRK